MLLTDKRATLGEFRPLVMAACAQAFVFEVLSLLSNTLDSYYGLELIFCSQCAVDWLAADTRLWGSLVSLRPLVMAACVQGFVFETVSLLSNTLDGYYGLVRAHILLSMRMRGGLVLWPTDRRATLRPLFMTFLLPNSSDDFFFFFRVVSHCNTLYAVLTGAPYISSILRACPQCRSLCCLRVVLFTDPFSCCTAHIVLLVYYN